MIKLISEIFRNKSGKIIMPLFIFGLIGLCIEIIYRAFYGSMVGFYEDLSYMSLMGYTSVWMVTVYGFGGMALSVINEVPKYYNLKMIWQMLIGGFALIVIELIFGVIFNICLGLYLWDYSDKFMNLWGQICLFNSVLWVIATPFFIFVCDYVGWALYRENEAWHYRVYDNYIDIFKGI